MQPCTFEGELNQRWFRAEQREDDRQWAALQEKREPDSETFSERFAALLNRLKVWFHHR